MHLSPVEPPACPVCEQPAVKNRVRPEQLGPWWCDGCALLFYGTTSEFEHYAPHRQRRQELLRERTAD